MERNERSGQIAEKSLYTKLSSLENEEVGEIERFRKKLNVIEVKIDDIYSHLMSNQTIDPSKNLVSKLNILAAALLTVGLVVLLIGYLGTDSMMTAASAGISICGLIVMYASVYLQSSSRAKSGAMRAKDK